VLYSSSVAAEQVETPDRFVLDERAIEQPRWVLVLSGGGARGIAQIGVLRMLEREQLYPSAVVGTSIGAIIGGLWCAGYSADEIDSLVRAINWQELLRLGDERTRSDLFLDQKSEYDRTVLSIRLDKLQPVVPEAVSGGQRLEMLLSELFWNAPYQCGGSFSSLRIPFCAVATDLVRGTSVAFRHGNLATIVRASSTFPLRYAPVRLDSMVLVDGGLLANIPTSIAIEEFKTDLVVAVNTTSPLLPPSLLNKPWNIADQVVTLMMQRFNAAASRQAWLEITPDLGDHSTLDFSRFDWLITQGERAAHAAIAQLKDEYARRTTNHLRSLLNASRALGTAEAVASTGTTATPADRDAMLSDVLERVRYWGAVEYRYDSHSSTFSVAPCAARQIRAVNATPEPLALELRRLVGLWYSTWRADSLRQAVERACRRHGLAMARLRIEFDTSTHVLHALLDSGRVVAIELVGNRSATDLAVRRELSVQAGQPVRTNDLVNSWERLLATDLFSAVQLSTRYLDSTTDAVVLTVRVEERGSQILRLGGRIDNERNVQPTLELAELNLASIGVRATARIGGGARNSIAALRLDAPRILESYWTASAEGYWDSRNIYLYRELDSLPPNRFERLRDGERLEQHLGIRAAVGSNVETLGKVAITLRYEHQRSFQLGDRQHSRAFAPLLALGWSTTLDDEDRADFPTHGSFLMLRFERTVLDLDGWLQFFKTEGLLRVTVPLASLHTLRWGVRFGIAANTLPLAESFNLGGEDLFFGMREEEERGRQLLLGHVEYRLRVPVKFIFPTYASVRYDVGAVWQRVQAIQLSSLKHGVGVSIGFDTPIGPARFSLGRAFSFRGGPGGVVMGPILGYFSIGMRIQ
jgi:NTE family protein